MDAELFPPWDTIPGMNKVSSTSKCFLVDHLGFRGAAPVQARCIPLLLSASDVVVEAITGSGKTLAYLVPAVEMLLLPRCRDACAQDPSAIIVLIILPARELAAQVYHVASRYIKFVSEALHQTFSCQCFMGGRDVAKDFASFQSTGSNIMIGTPGRLHELLILSKNASLFGTRYVELLVLDEADKLLEYGFRAKLDALLRKLPKQRRTALFSATQAREVADLARAGMRNPLSVVLRSAGCTTQNAEKPQIPQQVINRFTIIENSRKLDSLLAFLNTHQASKVIVYLLTCASVDWMVEALKILCPDRTSVIWALHGQMPQKRRTRVYAAVTKAECGVLLCTDVAARGLDIPDVGVVLQYDPPISPKTFIHRIGRTGRMGRGGESLVFLAPTEAEYVSFMKLQNVDLVPLRNADAVRQEEDDGVQPGNEQRRLDSVIRDRIRLKAIRGKGAIKARKTEKIRARKSRGHVVGDLCESPSIIALRRAAASSAHPELLKLATRAFVSFIRAYKEHECRYIFQLRLIDITDLVHSFALFTVPNCGEIRQMAFLTIPLQAEFDDFVQRTKAERMAARTSKRERESGAAEAQQGQEEPCTVGDESADEPHLKRHQSERNRRKEALKNPDLKLTENERRRAWKNAELDDLIRESYLIRKEKQGKISARRVDELVGNDALENAILSTRERRAAVKNRATPRHP